MTGSAFPHRTPANQDAAAQYHRGYLIAQAQCANWSDCRIAASLKAAAEVIATVRMRLGLTEYVHGMADGMADILARRHADATGEAWENGL